MSSRAQAEAPARLRYDALVPGGGPDHRADRPDQQRSPDDRFRLELIGGFRVASGAGLRGAGAELALNEANAPKSFYVGPTAQPRLRFFRAAWRLARPASRPGRRIAGGKRLHRRFRHFVVFLLRSALLCGFLGRRRFWLGHARLLAVGSHGRLSVQYRARKEKMGMLPPQASEAGDAPIRPRNDATRILSGSRAPRFPAPT